MLNLTHLKKHFNKGTPNEVLALDDCTLTIEKGEFVLLVGSNGSGKSTLLNLVAGTYFPDEGNIFIEGTDVTRLKDYQRSKFIARVFQDPMAGTAADLSIIDNFRLAALRTKRKTFKTGVNDSFKMKVSDRLSILELGLENKLDTLVGKLSGGQRQALTLLMSVMDESKILLLDEPTAALDPKSAEKIMKIAEKVIQELNLTAMLVTHNMHYAVSYGTRLVMLQQGQVIKDYPSVLKEKLLVTELYSWFERP
ncbi:MAG: ATP-binding cassette domain-containing protein [Chitinophagaceae bacterium]|nr:ATP-binding cassette domain-containing protein [Chitinophagaceae bacterium]